MKHRGLSITLGALIFIAGIISVSHAQSIENTSQEIMWIDNNNCGPDGPQGAWLSYKVINDTGSDLSNLTVSFDGFTGGDTHIFKLPGDPVREFSYLANTDTVPVYFYIDYSEVCNFPTGGGSCSFDGYTADFTLSVHSSENGTVQHSRTLTTDCLLSASAAGQVESVQFGPGIWVGQILSQVVEYSFGNNVDLFFQPIGNAAFPDYAYRLVGSVITGVTGNMSTDVIGLKDALHFPDLEVPGNGGTIVVQYFWEVISVYDEIYINPWACAKSGNKYKFSGFGEAVPISGSDQAASIKKTVEPEYFEPISYDGGFGAGIARWTITLYNETPDVDIVVDTIRDIVPSCMIITDALVYGSDISLSMAASTPLTGSSDEVKWVGYKPEDPSNYEFRIPANDSIKLIYETDITGCDYPASYSNYASMDIRNTTVGPAQATIGINCLPPVFDPFEDLTACNSFELPEISGKNLTGAEAYYDDSQENGGQLISGPISESMTVWVYDEIEDNPACADEEFFTVTIINGPEITNPGDQAVCDSLVLPEISGINLSGNESYYDNSQANGGQAIIGPVKTSQIVWIYDESGTDPNCYEEQSFSVTVSAEPILDNPGDQLACDSYDLPIISGSNLTGSQAYYNDSQANGGQPISGPVISSQTVWIYDQVGTSHSCFDEQSFHVKIDASPQIENPGDQLACDSYDLPGISGTNLSGNQAYYNNSQENGGQPVSGPITSGQTIWIYDVHPENEACFDETSFDVTINESPEFISDINDIQCYGNSTGSVELTLISGTGPFEYDWSSLNGDGLEQGQEDQYGLAAGDYDVRISDSNECFLEMSFNLSQPDGALSMTSDMRHVSCEDPASAWITVELSGGTAPYSYYWMGPDGYSNNVPAISNLKAGDYSLEVKDANDCQIQRNFNILEACLEVNKTLDPPDQQYNTVGQLVNFKIVLTNSGSLDIYQAALSDPLLDDQLVYLGGDQNLNGMLNAGEQWLFSGLYEVKQEDIDQGSITNVVTATGLVDLDNDGLYETPLSVSDQVAAEAQQTPKISLIKQAVLPLEDSNNDGVPGYLGDLVEYVFRVENTGNITLYNFEVSDPIAEVDGVEIPQISPGNFDLDSYSATIEITQAHLDAEVIINSAEVTASVSPGGEKEVFDISDDPADLENEDLNGDGDPDDPTEVVVQGNASIGDLVWMDSNGDGIQNVGETGVSGVHVQLYNLDQEMVGSKVTDGSGHFVFDEVRPGKYFLKFIVGNPNLEFSIYKSGVDVKMDSDVNDSNGPGTTPWLSIGPAQNSMDIDAGVYTCVTFTGFNWCDFNRNSVCEESENGINGLCVSLYKWHKGEWLFWDSVISNHGPETPGSDGFFTFCTIPGKYYLHFQMPPRGLSFVQPFMGDDDHSSSHVTHDNGYGTTQSFILNCNPSGSSCKILFSGYMYDTGPH